MRTLNLIRRLKTAGVCCKDCGLTYGVFSVGCSTNWNGICHVCGEEGLVTETRDYGYLRKGIRELMIQDQKQKLGEVL